MRGRKKDTPLQRSAWPRGRAVFRRAIEFFYATYPLKTKHDQNTAIRLSKDHVDSANPDSPNSIYALNTILRRGQADCEDFYERDWPSLKKQERAIPSFMKKIGWVKDEKDLRPHYEEGLEAANYGLKKLKGFSTNPPTAEQAFGILMKLRIRPDEIWPEELEPSRWLITILEKLRDLVVLRQTVSFEPEEALHMELVSTGGAVSADEWQRSIENFIQPILLTLSPNLDGSRKSFYESIDRQSGKLLIKIDDKTAVVIKKKNGKMKIIQWAEFESHLKSQ